MNAPLRQKQNKSMVRGFTLPELLVVMFIVGILAAIVFPLWTDVERKRNTSKTLGDLRSIEAAIARLAADTSRYPDGDATKPSRICNANTNTTLNGSAAGLLSSDGNFPNWRGPYLSGTLTDPWGNPYRLATAYQCNAAVVGCDNVTEGSGKSVVIFSSGKDGTVSTADDVAVVLCRRP